MRSKFSIFIALFIGFFYSQLLLAAPQVLTSVSDKQVLLGDIFLLNIEIDDSDSDYQLDTRPLEEDFTVFRPSKSQRSEYINGNFSQQTQWQLKLQAKRVGELTIPALKIGQLSTQAIQISAHEASQQATKTADDMIFMENSINKNSLYTEQPLIFTSKIYIAQATENLNLSGPDLKGANIEVYGKDKNGETIRNGIRYKTITRQFQIMTSKVGEFIINSPVLNGDLLKQVNVSDWRKQVIGVPINIRGESLKIQIKDKPANYQGEWLVSEDVRLLENKSLADQEFHIGDPITRNISLKIASISTDKLPIISFNYPKNVRFYPDQDEIIEKQENGLLYAQRNMRHAIIPDQVGKLTLPEIKIAWWNSLTDKQEYAILPAQTVMILPAEKGLNNLESDLQNINSTPDTSKAVSDNSSLIYWQITTTLLLLGLILLVFYHVYYRHRHSSSRAVKRDAIPVKNQAYLNLRDALQENNAALVYQLLLTYLQDEKPNLKSLSQLADFIDLPKEEKNSFLEQIKLLEKACSGTLEDWNSAQLSTLIEKHLRQKTKHKDNNIMDLNP